MFCPKLLAILVLVLTTGGIAEDKVGFCKRKGNLYTISSPDCRCFHQRDIKNGNEGYHRCPGSLTFNPYECVCAFASSSTCHGSKTKKCPPDGQTNGPNGNGVGDGYCERNKNRYTISNNDCTCFHQKDLTNGNNGYHRCPAGTKFNPAVCVCDWPYNFKCKGSKTNICPGDNGPTDGNVTPDGLSCKSAGNLYTIKSQDCTCFKQLDMSNGNFGYHCCPDGTTFNPAVCVCDWPYNSKCKGHKLPKDDPQCKKCNGCTNTDIAFVVDGSGSIGSGNFEKIRKFIHALVNKLDIGPAKTQVGMCQFSKTVEKEFFMTGNQATITAGVSGMKYQDGPYTRTHLGLKYAREVLFSTSNGARDPASVTQMVIVITDGASSKPALTKVQSKLNHAAGFNTVAVGIAGANRAELEVIASKKENVFMIGNFDELAKLIKDIC